MNTTPPAPDTLRNIVFYEAFAEEEEAIRRALPPDLDVRFTWKTIQESGDSTAPRIVSIRTQSIVPAHWATEMHAILSRSTGHDHLVRYREMTGATAHLGYLPLYCHRAVAEHATLMWLSLLRRLPRQLHQFSRFHRDNITGHEAFEKRLLVVGAGNIGGEVARIASAMGLRVRAVDPVRKHPDLDYTTLEEGLPKADIVVCAMNLTEQNQAFFDREILLRTQPGLIFINIARGELSPAADLLRLLRDGHLAGVGLDVFNHESELAVALREGRRSRDPEVQAVLELARRDDVMLTPHNAFNTVESVERKAEQSIRQLLHLRDKGCFLWPVP